MNTIKGFDKAVCLRRNRLTAARGHVEGVPIRFLRGDDAFLRAGALVDAAGEIPTSDEDCLELINAGLPASADPLTLDDVYIHRIEAASSRFISDRFAFMGTSTLVNIATGAAQGVAFMNSHRTGDLSTPSELPFGRTFAGRYEAVMDDKGGVQERALIGFYMLRGIQPNGNSGPTTDDLHRMVLGGQIFDVSVGLLAGADGKTVCDVCGANYRSCPHLAGSNREMSMDEQQAQVDRGVPGGQASYRLEDYEISEVSAVYDGAVPGAGFSKGLAMMDELSDEELAAFRAAFAALLPDPGDAKPQRHSPTPEVIRATSVSAPGGQPGPAGTNTAPPKGAEKNPGNKPMFRQTLMNLFGAKGLGRFVAVLNTTTSEDPEVLGRLLTEQTEAQAQDLVEQHPIIALAKAHGVTDVEGFNAMLDRARDGDQYLKDVREEARKEAVRCFGADLGPMMGAAVDGQSLSQAKISRDAWRREADNKFGIGQNGEPAERKTAPAALATDAEDGKTAKTAWERLNKEQQEYATKQARCTTDEQKEAFAKNLLGEGI